MPSFPTFSFSSSPVASRIRGTRNSDQLGLNGPIINEAFVSLMELLGSDGKSDDRARIRRQEQIAQNTASRQRTVRNDFARMGLQNAGLADAIETAIATGGAQDFAQAAIDQASQEEQRRRQIQSLFTDLVLNPAISLEELEQVQRAQRKQAKQQKSAQRQSNILGAIGTAVSIASLFCWVAREVVPDEWKDVRYFMLNTDDEELRNAYKTQGPALAEEIKQNPALKEELRPRFELFAEAGRQMRKQHKGKK